MTAADALALGLARALPAVWVAPPLGSVSLPARVAVAGALTAIGWPALVGATGGNLLTEAMAGLALGLVASVPFRAAEAAGLILSTAAARRPGALGDALGLFALALFAVVGGPLHLANAWGQSYLILPPGGTLSGGLRVAVETGGLVIATAISLALPALGALLLAELFGGLLMKVQPVLSGGGGLRLAVTALALAAGIGGMVTILASVGLGALGATLEQAARQLGAP